MKSKLPKLPPRLVRLLRRYEQASRRLALGDYLNTCDEEDEQNRLKHGKAKKALWEAIRDLLPRHSAVPRAVQDEIDGAFGDPEWYK